MASPIDSDVVLCNRFLTRIGANTILSLDQETKEARVCKANFEFLRDDVNSAHAWGFAVKRVELAQSTTAPVYGASYAYTIPDDLLGFITEYNELQGIDAPYRIEGDYIVTNAASVKIEYVARITDLNKWSILAREALIARLQVELSRAITGTADGTKAYFDIYLNKLSLAGSHNAAESTPRELIVDTYLEARNGSYGVGSKVSDF